ncbi:MAG: hypothetical protein Kow0010_04200 [Dehalococcoidia bacterium]
MRPTFVAATPLVWVIDPVDQTVAAHRPGAASTIPRPNDAIGAQPVLSNVVRDVGSPFAILDGS